ncbi:hypothetical protein MAP00_002669 [Monascus purpureus]|nr:hypothetical protein MAP00_002669 [Monascus purpureus]
MRASSIDGPSIRLRGQWDTATNHGTPCDILVAGKYDEWNKYPAKQHAQRVAARLASSGGLIYLEGQPTINWEDSDQPRAFRQRRYFFYLSGVDELDCYLTYDIEAALLTLYIPDFDLRRAVWMGPTLTLEEARARYDVDRVRYFSSMQSDIEHWASKNNKKNPVFILHDSQKPHVSSTSLNLDSERLMSAANAAREIKDEHEIQLIRRANEISALAHRAILENIHRMSNETEIEALFLDTCVSQGAKNQSYSIIAGSGENAAVLHYVKNDEPLKGRQLVCLDAGAEWNCYASDVTRTFPLTAEWPSAEARNIYHLVQEMQEECIKTIKEGVRMLDLQRVAEELAVRGLKELGILKDGDVAELLESGVSKVFFPHGLGHHVGLEVHDVSAALARSESSGDVIHGPMLPATSHAPCTATAPALEEGMVVTIEPGIYFSRYALANAKKTQPLAKYIDFDVVERYLPVGGVRIEDDILVMKHGHENLTTAPKGEEMLEIIRNGRK